MNGKRPSTEWTFYSVVWFSAMVKLFVIGIMEIKIYNFECLHVLADLKGLQYSEKWKVDDLYILDDVEALHLLENGITNLDIGYREYLSTVLILIIGRIFIYL